MRRRIVGLAAAAAAVVAAACGAGPGETPALVEAVVDTVDGVERWLYPGSGGPALAWRADTLAVIGGALVEEDEYNFGNVLPTGLASDAAGNLYVLDRQAKRVLKYDPRGRHLATYGRAGGGPGELSLPLAIAIGPGDSIWVSDFGNRRYVILPQDGGSPRSQPLDAALGIPRRTLAIRGGALIQGFMPLPGMANRAAAPRAAAASESGTRDEAPPQEAPHPILRIGMTGAVQDTLWLHRPPVTNTVQSRSQGGVIMIRMPQAFDPALRWQAFADGGIVVSDSTAYVLHLRTPDGAAERLVERDLPPRETTEADREFARERLRERDRTGAAVRIAIGDGPAAAPPPNLLEAQLRSMTFAPVIPRVTGLRVDDRDRIWVGVSLDRPEETERIDIYDSNGTLLGELTGWEVPDVFLGGSLAAKLTQDEMDVQQIVIYRIREGGAERD